MALQRLKGGSKDDEILQKEEKFVKEKLDTAEKKKGKRERVEEKEKEEGK